MNRNDAKRLLGERVRALRETRGVSRAKLAAKVGATDQAHIRRIEKGLTLASIIVYLKIADFFDVSYDSLFQGAADGLLPDVQGEGIYASGKE